MKIAVIQPKMIGDVLITSVIFEELKQKFPTAELHFIVNKNTIPVLENNPFIDKIEYLGILNKKQLNNYLQKTKFTILSGENTSSLFFLDCINNNVSIFYNKESIPSYDLFKIKPSSLFPIDYNNPNQSLKEIYQIVPI